MPKDLPDFSSLEKISNYFVETVSRIFKFALDVNVNASENFNNFLKNPPTMELKEIYDADGIVSHCSEEYDVQEGQDPRTFLYLTVEKNSVEHNRF